MNNQMALCNVILQVGIAVTCMLTSSNWYVELPVPAVHPAYTCPASHACTRLHLHCHCRLGGQLASHAEHLAWQHLVLQAYNVSSIASTQVWEGWVLSCKTLIA